jgi:glycosyltransferase involved in cell wall biosynthesis
MVQVLNSDMSDGCCGSYFFQADLQHAEQIADAADLLVICRSGYNNNINQLIKKFRIRAKRVYFDIDDFVFDTSYTHLVVNTLGLDQDDPRVWDDWFAMMGRMGQTMRMCDGVITTNQYLAARIFEFSGLPVKVIPNFMNCEQLEISEQLFENKMNCGFAKDDTFLMGYFSGSPSHKRDYEIVESALCEIMDEDSRVRLVVVGYIDAGASLTRFGDRVVHQPFQDYVNLQRLISKVEFNLMPLQSNVFTNCKSELKYFEAAVVGTLSVASPSQNYAAVIRDGENGYLARAHQWLSVMQRAISEFGKYTEMATEARADVLRKYAWYNQRATILEALGFDSPIHQS